MPRIRDSRDRSVSRAISRKALEKRAQLVLKSKAEEHAAARAKQSEAPAKPSSIFRRLVIIVGTVLGILGGGGFLIGAFAGGLAGLASPFLLYAYLRTGSAENGVAWAGLFYVAAILLTAIVGVARSGIHGPRGDTKYYSGQARKARLCAACGYALNGLAPEADGCTVCPECSAAWKLPLCDSLAECEVCASSLVGAKVREDGKVHCPTCNAEFWLAFG